MKLNIIAFTGVMGAGKSEAISILRDYLKASSAHSSKIQVVKFAQPLYDIQEFAYDRISGVYSRPSSFTKDRLLLQWLGTEWGRSQIHPDLWVKLWASDVEKTHRENPSTVVVCDDCRFDNEAAAVQQSGGKIIKISSNRNKERIDTSRALHQSEHGVSNDYIDYIVENNASIEEYKIQLTYLFNKLRLE